MPDLLITPTTNGCLVHPVLKKKEKKRGCLVHPIARSHKAVPHRKVAGLLAEAAEGSRPAVSLPYPALAHTSLYDPFVRVVVTNSTTMSG